MDPHEPFLKAILASRHDDLPRLVYADFLEESGEPEHVARAHFIRTQIHLETAVPRTKVYRELKALETRFLDFYLDEWRYELPEFVRYGSALDQVQWRRGFPDDLGPMTVTQFHASGARAIGSLPLTGLHLRGRSDPFEFDHHPEFAEVSRLAFTNFDPLVTPPGDDSPSRTVTFTSLLACPLFTNLRHLDLSENQLTDAWVIRFATAFANASFAPTLETLDLSRNFGITDAGANVLATAPGLDGLKQLNLRDTSVTHSGRAMLLKRFGQRLA